MTCSWRMVTCFPSGRTILQLLCLQLCVPLGIAEYHAWALTWPMPAPFEDGPSLELFWACMHGK